MRRSARTDLCGGRPVMLVPTATVWNPILISRRRNERGPFRMQTQSHSQSFPKLGRFLSLRCLTNVSNSVIAPDSFFASRGSPFRSRSRPPYFSFVLIELAASVRLRLARLLSRCAQFCAHPVLTSRTVRRLQKDGRSARTWTRCCVRRFAPVSKRRSLIRRAV